jgi:phosphohistidine phosphatase
MKELLILRHAKSSWKHPELEDHDRPLNKRGKRDAPRMGRWIRGQDLLPDVIVSSTAVRAWTTAELVARVSGFRGELYSSRELYLGGHLPYLASGARYGGRGGRVLIVGHNPDVEDLVTVLTRAREAMPTAALAHVQLPIDDWEELTQPPTGELLAVWRPKELPAD